MEYEQRMSTRAPARLPIQENEYEEKKKWQIGDLARSFAVMDTLFFGVCACVCAGAHLNIAVLYNFKIATVHVKPLFTVAAFYNNLLFYLFNLPLNLRLKC